MSDLKRLHFFNNQFLVEADFTDEQKYHLDMRRLHNRVLHQHGVAEGLEVRKTADKAISVGKGVAVDSGGRELVQAEDLAISLADNTVFPAGSMVHVSIVYHEQESDPTTATGVTGNTRVTESPQAIASTSVPPTDGSVILLGQFTLDGSGNVPGSVGDFLHGDVRQVAGAALPPGSVGTTELADGAVSLEKLKADLVLDSEISLEAGREEVLKAVEHPCTGPVCPFLPFLLVYAYSPDDGAKFRWDREYSTDSGNVGQTVRFQNMSAVAIRIRVRIYAIPTS